MDLRYGKYFFVQVKDEVYTYGADIEKSLDANRKKIFLEPIYFARKKAIFNKKTKLPFHLSGGRMARHGSMNEEQYNQTMAELHAQGYQFYIKLNSENDSILKGDMD